MSDAPRNRPGWLAWLLAAPMLTWLVVLVAAPTAAMFVYSFCDRDELGQVVLRFSGDAWARVLEPTYLRVFLRSLAYGALTTVLSVLVGYPVGWAIAIAPRRWQAKLLVLIAVPFFTSFLVRAYAWMTILKAEGLVNRVLLVARIINAPLELLYTPAAVVIGLVYAYVPFVVLPVYGSAEKLDPALLEAALDLGAKPSAAFFRVALPLTMPGLLTGAMLVFVPAIGMFAVTDLLGGARVPLLGNVIQNQFGQARNWPLGAALSTALLGLFVVTYALFAPRGRARGVT